MANTLSYLSGLQMTRTSPAQPVNIPTMTTDITQSGNVIYSDTQNIGTSAETVNTGSVGTLGVMSIQNLSSANFVKVGLVDSAAAPAYFMKLKPGERWETRLVPGITIKAIADTAACDCQVTIYED